MTDWKGKEILVLGAARQGTAISRYLSTFGARVTLNDRANSETLVSIKEELKDLSIEYHFGDHPNSLLENKGLLILSGGVSPELPLVIEAKKREIEITNDSQIFFDEINNSNVIGITGSAGKTTTTTLVGEIARNAVEKDQKVWVGGNIGLPLINYVQEISPNDIVVLELSSFQLELMNTSPSIAAVLNITPNHLDRHHTMKAYSNAKARILDFQGSQDKSIINCDDPGSWNLRNRVKGELFSFGFEKAKENNHVYCKDKSVFATTSNGYEKLFDINDIQLSGRHNLINAIAAGAISFAAGFSPDSIQKGIKSVKGIPHRLEVVLIRNEVKWVNDSIATAPERTIAAVNSFTEPIVLLLGGRDKDLPWDGLAKEIHNKVKHVILFGEAADLIENSLKKFESGTYPYSLNKYRSLQPAVLKAEKIAETGDVVLLAPGGTSFDEFKDFEERGRYFRKYVESFDE